MRLLLDTHVFLWLQHEPERLGPDLELFRDPEHSLLLSAASTWELAIKVALGKLALPGAVLEYVASRAAAMGIELIPVSHAHAAAVVRLDEIHRDPFDRLLVAQAAVERLELATSDPLLAEYGPHVRIVGRG